MPSAMRRGLRQSVEQPQLRLSPIPQTIRNRCGGLSSPMLSIVVITKVPESDEVINHVANRIVASAAMHQLSQFTVVTWSIVP